MKHAVPLPALVALSLMASACASSGDYPSLARRDAERITGTALPGDAAPVPPPVPTPPSAELTAQISALVEQARAAHARFVAARPRAEALVDAAGNRGTDSWSVAAVALAVLDSERAQLMRPLAELDALFVAERVAQFDQDTGDALALAQARDQVQAWLAEEEPVLDRLAGKLRV